MRRAAPAPDPSAAAPARARRHSRRHGLARRPAGMRLRRSKVHHWSCAAAQSRRRPSSASSELPGQASLQAAGALAALPALPPAASSVRRARRREQALTPRPASDARGQRARPERGVSSSDATRAHRAVPATAGTRASSQRDRERAQDDSPAEDACPPPAARQRRQRPAAPWVARAGRNHRPGEDAKKCQAPAALRRSTPVSCVRLAARRPRDGGAVAASHA